MMKESDNIKIIINDEADEVIEELFKSLKNRYQNNLESMKGSEFVFDYVHLLYYKCHKINFNDKKIRKSTFCKNKKVNNIEDINVNNILVSKKKHTARKIHLNTLSDIMIMTLLDHYV